MTPDTAAARTQAQTLRAIADLLVGYADLGEPYITVSTARTEATVTWGLTYGVDPQDQKTSAARIIKAFGGKWDKDFDWPEGQDRADFVQRRDGIVLRIVVERTAVCERVVTGVETITVPAVEAMAERTEDREIVEWRCEPLLSEEVLR